MTSVRSITSLNVGGVVDRLRALDLDKPHPEWDFTLPGLLHKSIFLRCHAGPTLDNWFQDLPVFDWPLFSALPELRELLDQAQAKIRQEGPIGELGRVVFSVVDPQGFIQWHVDLGEYAKAHRRFHISLFTTMHALIYAPGEIAHLPAGMLAELDTQAPHSAGNWSDKARIHALFEMRRA